jgi:hypothetical protein
METWKAITGIILLVVGGAVAWQNYITNTSCNSLVGKIGTFISALFGGTSAQACYNAQIAMVGGFIVAIVGLVIIYFAVAEPAKKKRK